LVLLEAILICLEVRGDQADQLEEREQNQSEHQHQREPALVSKARRKTTCHENLLSLCDRCFSLFLVSPRNLKDRMGQMSHPARKPEKAQPNRCISIKRRAWADCARKGKERSPLIRVYASS